MAENDNTIKRYLKEIDQTKEFAITKFAKELLDVRDNLEMGGNFIKTIKIDEKTSIEELKKHFE
jgi:molecular chaperone GrpE (heat shock protein)